MIKFLFLFSGLLLSALCATTAQADGTGFPDKDKVYVINRFGNQSGYIFQSGSQLLTTLQTANSGDLFLQKKRTVSTYKMSQPAGIYKAATCLRWAAEASPFRWEKPQWNIKYAKTTLPERPQTATTI